MRSQAGRWWRSTSASVITPIRKQPVTLIVNVASGKIEMLRCSIEAVEEVTGRGSERAAERDADDDGHAWLLSNR